MIRCLAIALLAGAMLVGAVVVHDTFCTALARVRLHADGISSSRPVHILQVSDFHDISWDRQVDSIVRRAGRLRLGQP